MSWSRSFKSKKKQPFHLFFFKKTGSESGLDVVVSLFLSFHIVKHVEGQESQEKEKDDEEEKVHQHPTVCSQGRRDEHEDVQ